VNLPEEETICVTADDTLMHPYWTLHFEGFGMKARGYDFFDLRPRLASEGKKTVREALRSDGPFTLLDPLANGAFCQTGTRRFRRLGSGSTHLGG
jgi:hypothetical protein